MSLTYVERRHGRRKIVTLEPCRVPDVLCVDVLIFVTW